MTEKKPKKILYQCSAFMIAQAKYKKDNPKKRLVRTEHNDKQETLARDGR